MAGTTRERLLDAAQRLYAERGLDAVSLREINQASGSRNATAVQYHFTDRAGVVAGILARHLPEVDARRHALLDAHLDTHPGGGTAAPGERLRELAGALVRPMAARLADPGGREFLQLWAELVSRPRGLAGPADMGGTVHTSLRRWRDLVGPLLEPEAVRLHRRYTAILHASLELGRRARTGPRTDDRLFTSHLVDVVTAVLGAPVSAETRRLAAERDAARSADPAAANPSGKRG